MTSTYADLADVAAKQKLTAALFNQLIHNVDFLRNPPYGLYAAGLGDANITTSSTSFVDLTGYSRTVVSQGNPMLMMLMGRSAGNTRFDFLIDGVSITGDSDGVGAGPATQGITTIARIVQPSAGSRVFKVQWRSTSGAVTFYPAGLGQLYVVEAW